MNANNMHTLEAIANTAQYAGLALGLIFVSTMCFVWLTPYDDFKEIREGKVASAIAMRGAVYGFTAPVLAMSYYGANILDFVVWAAIACVAQLVLYVVVDRIMDKMNNVNNVACAEAYKTFAVFSQLFDRVWSAATILRHQL